MDDLIEERIKHIAEMDIESAKQYIMKFCPVLWSRVSKEDMDMLLKLTHSMFKTRPDLLEAKTRNQYGYTQ